MRSWIAIAALTLLIASAAGAWWLWNELHSPYYGGPPEGSFVEIPRGAGTSTVADMLERAGAIRHTLPFTLYVRWSASGRRLQAGEYRFDAPLSPVQVIDRIVRGATYYISVTLPEGLTARETVEQIARSGVGELRALEAGLQRVDLVGDLAPDARTLEGYLFPETYHFPRKVAPDEVLRTLVAQFRIHYSKIAAEHPPAPGWSTSRIVTLASLIEKEVGNDERPVVASVFVNRIEKGIPLGCDPTIIYALKLAGRWDGNIRKSDLSMDSPYNTYLRQGLPPGPIANPGAASLRAALAPARTDYLYFVSRNDGTHYFSSDYQAHSQAVARYQRSGR